LEARITSKNALSLSNSESEEALDDVDISAVTEVRAVIEVIKAGLKRLQTLLLWPMFHVMTATLPLWRRRRKDGEVSREKSRAQPSSLPPH
jgi:hypothetical protein